ncbi:lecithin retinol acyltransferase family protein [Leptolyngbya sp. AN02str]|uniref:lecithin retinol acyltransferase family protein n=1 Tax=Leptolyngbya sp. AN02str TaxID=3423363 RepID=UPI003D313FD3
MARGDQIYVMRPLLNMDGVYEHHGIDCGDGTVIHFSKAEAQPVIKRSSWQDFSWGNPVYVKEYEVSYIPDVVVERAESRLGDRSYSLLSNNCEHFATWCKIGRNESKQISNFGLDLDLVEIARKGGLVDATTQAEDPIQSAILIEQALQNVAIARAQLQAQLDHITKDMDTWHRVAQLALQQNKEAAARAALERKVAEKRKLPNLQAQLDHLNQMNDTLLRNKQTLRQQVPIV